MIHCLSYDVYNFKFDMGFQNKLEDIKQYRQPVMTKDNVDFLGSVLQKFWRIKVMTKVIIYESNPKFLYENYYL